MAQIDFQILTQNTMVPSLTTLSGSGLGFFGSTQGSSVQIGSFQDTTNVSNADGSVIKDSTNNIKYTTSVFPSGRCVMTSNGGTSTVGLSGVKSFQGTLGITFSHSTDVNAQNCQLRIYDRTNVNYPASGVNTKVAEIVNHNGSTYNSQGTNSQSSDAVGSGDILWWGEQWPTEIVSSNNYYINSQGVTFYNGTGATTVNGDSRLGQVTGDRATVGGTGIVVPLLDSPGSGQRGLQKTYVTNAAATIPGMTFPKWTQYCNATSRQSLFFGSSAHNFGDGSSATPASQKKTFGGTGIDSHHTWSVALSASPLSIGSKEQYGLYVSLEYL
jgi:hypothetical protein